MAISEEVTDEEVEASPMVELPPLDNPIPPDDPLEVELLISLHTLTSVSAPQTLKLIGYIKHRKVIIRVDSGNIHNFIDCHIAQEINRYICSINNFKS